MIADIYDPTDYVIETQIQGASEPIFIGSNTTPSLQMNLSVSSLHLLKFWGQLLTTSNLPLYKAQVELLEVRHTCTQFSFKKLAQTMTDPSGFYYFEHSTSHICCYYLSVLSPNPHYNQLLFSNLNRCYNKPCMDCPCYKQFQKGGAF